MRIGIDVDGCLVNFNESFAEILVAVSGGKHLCPSTWQNDDPPCWNWDQHYGYSSAESAKAWDLVIQSSVFWESLYPLPHTYKVLENLNRLAHAGDEVYFLTDRRGRKCKWQTERWLHQRGMLYPCVILTADKLSIVRELEIDIFIDDKLNTVDAVGLFAHEEHLSVDGRVYLKDAAYNRDRPDNWCYYHIVPSVKNMLEREGLWHP